MIGAIGGGNRTVTPCAIFGSIIVLADNQVGTSVIGNGVCLANQVGFLGRVRIVPERHGNLGIRAGSPGYAYRLSQSPSTVASCPLDFDLRLSARDRRRRIPVPAGCVWVGVVVVGGVAVSHVTDAVAFIGADVLRVKLFDTRRALKPRDAPIFVHAKLQVAHAAARSKLIGAVALVSGLAASPLGFS